MASIARRVTAYAGGVPFTYSVYQLNPRDAAAPRHKPIALVCNDATAPWELDAIVAFQNELFNLFPVGQAPEFHVFSAQNSARMFQMTIIPYLIENPEMYDIVVAFGQRVAPDIRDLQISNHLPFRLIFVGIENVVNFNLLARNEIARKEVTGIRRGLPEYNALVTTLQTLRPDASRVYFPVDRRTDERTWVESPLYDSLTVGGYDVKPLPLRHDVEAGHQVSDCITPKSVLCFDFSFGTLPHVPSLIEFCNETSVTMAAADLTSVKRGAALGCGDAGYSYGEILGRMVHEVLYNSRDFSTLPVGHIREASAVRFNPRAFKKQSISLTKAELTCLSACSIDYSVG